MAKLPKAKHDGWKLERMIHRRYEKVPDARRGIVTGRNERLGASQIGNACERALLYQIRHAVPLRGDVPFDGRMHRLFERGHREEAWVVDDMRAAGIQLINDTKSLDEYVARVERGASPDANMVGAYMARAAKSLGEEFEQIRFSTLGGHLSGSCDGIIVGGYDDDPRPMLFECKTSAHSPFLKLKRHGVKKAKPKHWAQMQAYMGGITLGGVELERALYVVVCKNDDHVYAEVVEREPGAYEEIVAKARRVLEGHDVPERVGADPKSFPCGWCDYRRTCHGEELPGRNCRTCVHARADFGDATLFDPVEGDAVWRCVKQNDFRVLSREEQGTGCGWHLYDPDLVSGLDVVDVDGRGLGTVPAWVEYVNVNGHRVRNHVSPVRPLVFDGNDVALDAMLIDRDLERAPEGVLGAEAFQIAFRRFVAGETAEDALAHSLGFDELDAVELGGD